MSLTQNLKNAVQLVFLLTYSSTVCASTNDEQTALVTNKVQEFSTQKICSSFKIFHFNLQINLGEQESTNTSKRKVSERKKMP